MSGRLSGLKDAIKAERQPQPKPQTDESQAPAVKPSGTRAKARVGKHAVVGYFSPELSTTLNVMAAERRSTVQALLGEAIDLLMRENGKHPFGER
jgi:hypothetical protein